MARLPQPGSDDGTWGSILNDFLGQAHTSDGSLKPGTVGASQLQAGSITDTTISGSAAIARSKLDSNTQTSLGKADTSIQSGQTAAGDLAGTYPNPTVAKLNGVTISGTPSNGQVLTAGSSSAASWSSPPSAPVASVNTRTGAVTGLAEALSTTAVQTTNYTAGANELVPVDTTSGAVTITLPNAPTDKTRITIKHIIQGGTNAVTYQCAGSDVINKTGGSTSGTLSQLNQAVTLQYKASGAIWTIESDDLPLSALDIVHAEAVSAKDPRYGGAKGDGSTDDTTALQTFITYCINNNRRGFIPAGTYKITAALNFTLKPQWAITGEDWGTTTIKQYTDNTPIFNIGSDTASSMHTWTIENIAFDYANPQPSTNTSANPIRFSQMAYEGSLKKLKFLRGSWGIKVAAGVSSPWGTVWDELWFAPGLTGGAMDWTGAIQGTPNNHFGRMLMQCDNMVGPVFSVRGYNFAIDELEFLAANNGPVLFYLASGGQVSIRSAKLEIGAYATGQSTYMFGTDSGGFIDIGSVTIGGTTMTLNGISPSIFFAGSGAGSRIRCGYVNCTVTSATSGTLYVASANAQPGIEIDTAVIGSNCALQNYGSSTSAEYIKVKQWQNDRMSQDKGDADYTVTLGDPNIIVYGTTLTGQRTVTLPSDGNNLHNGLYYEVIANGAINGANTIIVKSATTTLATITGDGQIYRFTWSRSDAAHAYNGWRITKRSILATPVPTDVQTFTSSGTWTKPTGAKTVNVILIGGGGGGGSGRRGAAGTIRGGGGGGGGGARVEATFDQSQFGATATVTVGTAGSGAPAITTDDTDGTAGTSGANTIVTMAAGLAALRAGGGTGGGGGTVAAGTAGSPGLPGASSGGAGGTGNGASSSSPSTLSGSGGGGGGGVSAANAFGQGGIAFGPADINPYAGVLGGTTDGANGATSAVVRASGLCGMPGGGGAGSVLTNGGSGGSAAGYGCGGGGGGASVNATGNSGAGGNGSPGIVIITTYF